MEGLVLVMGGLIVFVIGIVVGIFTLGFDLRFGFRLFYLCIEFTLVA